MTHGATEFTQVGIIGGGPAGLILAMLLRRAGIPSVLIETRSRAYCEKRVRAGVLEHHSVALLDTLGIGTRMHREGLVHEGVYLRFGGHSHRLDFPELTGKSIMVYGQHEVVKDLIAAHERADDLPRYEVSQVRIADVTSDQPTIFYTDASGAEHELRCSYIAGCDGFHGLSRGCIPPDVLRIYERVYPFAWLGILSDSPPVSPELIYAHHERGFALYSQRSPSVQRMYLQCAIEEDLTAWPDDRIWNELERRLAGDAPPPLVRGAITQKGVTPMRSFVAEPMQYGRLFLAGDAAHIVPPTGAKGMNLAIADVAVLAHALTAHIVEGDARLLDGYSATCLERVWRTERFSSWMTSMLHRNPADDDFGRRIQLAELDNVVQSRAAAQNFAEQYVGLPFPI